jgi:hypothetical protein
MHLSKLGNAVERVSLDKTVCLLGLLVESRSPRSCFSKFNVTDISAFNSGLLMAQVSAKTDYMK